MTPSQQLLNETHYYITITMVIQSLGCGPKSTTQRYVVKALCKQMIHKSSWNTLWYFKQYTDKSCYRQFVLVSHPNPNLVRKYMQRMEESVVLNK